MARRGDNLAQSGRMRVWEPRLDTDGHFIQAHGGGVLPYEGRTYWYGENKGAPNVIRDGQTADRVDVIGISCYSSEDLIHWRNEGVVLPAVPDDPDHDLHPYKVAERPKVLFNPRTKQFVMRLHVDTQDYKYARQGIAVADSPVGPFIYVGSEAPVGRDSRDMTLWQEGDAAWTIFSSDWNSTLTIARLSDDYLTCTGHFTEAFPGEYREAPAIFRWKTGLAMLSSGCTGWDPNEARVDFAPEIEGPWTAGPNPCIGPDAEKTFLGQSTFVLETDQGPIAMLDRWRKHDLQHSDYLWLAIQDRDGIPTLEKL